jgi:hypothetical protein
VTVQTPAAAKADTGALLVNMNLIGPASSLAIVG